jgi:ribonucleoside-diphosphate reductase beta chain
MATNPLSIFPSLNEYTLFPIDHQDIWEMVMKHVKSIWFVGEVDLSSDLVDWDTKLNDDERKFIKHVLAFFAAADGIVMDNLARRFMTEIDIKEVNAFYTVQMFIEFVHNMMYSTLIETYISDANEKHYLFNALHHLPVVAKKGNWAKKWISSNERFSVRLAAFAVVEGIFFSGAFCAIFWLKHKGLMPGLCESNELISNDETLHVIFAILLYTKYANDLMSEKEFHAMIVEAVDIEKEFIIDAIPCSLVGINMSSMSEYIEFIADRLCMQMGYEALYNSKNPFDFMNMISLPGKTDFFVRRPTEYQRISEVIDINHIAKCDF